ncbi:hypothetical protein GGS21DRAFT_490200 [Xylaria nigripes]|nr:hypothetical protein GGS21DRAFT_490200 [Xylaria nigripes]
MAEMQEFTFSFSNPHPEHNHETPVQPNPAQDNFNIPMENPIGDDGWGPGSQREADSERHLRCLRAMLLFFIVIFATFDNAQRRVFWTLVAHACLIFLALPVAVWIASHRH